jgi:hypothetical protein
MTRTWIVFGSNVCDLESSFDPFHCKLYGCYAFSPIVVLPHYVTCMFCALVALAHCNGTFTVKVDVGGFHVVSSIPSNSANSICRWLAAMTAMHHSL